MTAWVVIFAFIGIGCIALTGYVTNPSTSFALKLAAWFFIILAAVMMGLVVLEEINRMVEVQTEWMRQFSKLDDEGKAAVAFVFPHMRYRMKSGKVREFFDDTNVPIDMFRDFLADSNDKYISPQRNWQTSERPPWAWLEIYNYLCEKKYIFPGSASGNISHQWKGESYRHLMAYWMAGRKIVNISEREEE